MLGTVRCCTPAGREAGSHQEVRNPRAGYRSTPPLDLFADGAQVCAACLPRALRRRDAGDRRLEAWRDGITEAECGIAKGSLQELGWC